MREKRPMVACFYVSLSTGPGGEGWGEGASLFPAEFRRAFLLEAAQAVLEIFRC